MEFEDYCLMRLGRLFKKMERDESKLLLEGAKCTRGMYRPVPEAHVGRFLKLYIDYKNQLHPKDPPPKEKKEAKDKAFKGIMTFKFILPEE